MVLLIEALIYSSCAARLVKCFRLLHCSLSVTKWVHLNWGDEGLITLFSKVWRLLLPVMVVYIVLSMIIFILSLNCCGVWLWIVLVLSAANLFYEIWPSRCYSFLKQGGVFVLEPQPWKSYENNRLVSEVNSSFELLSESYYMNKQLINYWVWSNLKGCCEPFFCTQ